ncbi:hypothetical protein Fcan01_12430 [Folsomia candida]|uniref:Uncharacterized protein n=1 Tax=Folsomia candida TaxID=158441 RepID=A0A226E6N1_FOLCA|nr:hypothetical protein Fcan01_12430 [Folsomia candida]
MLVAMSEPKQVQAEVKGVVLEKRISYSMLYAAGNIVLFDNLGILTNGKKRARIARSAFEVLSESLYASATAFVPIQIASKLSLDYVPDYLKCHGQGVTKKKTKTVFESFVVSKGKGRFAYVTPEKEIPFKDCFVPLKRCKISGHSYRSTSDVVIEVQDKKTRVKRQRTNIKQTSILQFFFKSQKQDEEPEQISEENMKANPGPIATISVRFSTTPRRVIELVNAPSPPPLNPVLEGIRMSIQHTTLLRRKYSQIFDCDDTSDLENFEVDPKTDQNKLHTYFHPLTEEERGAKFLPMMQYSQLKEDVEESHELPSDLLEDIFSLEDNFGSMKPSQNANSFDNVCSAFPSSTSFSSIASFNGFEDVQDMLKDINYNDLTEMGFECMDAT